MYRGLFITMVISWPLVVMADGHVHSVEITSPTVAECVNNGDEVITGGIAGGELLVDGRDVPVTFRASSPGGEDLMLTFLTEWTEVLPNGEEVDRQEMYQATLQFPDGITEIETSDFPIPGFFIGDGDGVVLTIRSEHPLEPVAESRVEFDLDRQPPNALFAPAVLDAAVNECSGNPADLDFSVTDNRTAPEAIQSSVRIERDGCRVRRLIVLRDDCGSGNAQEIEVASLAPAEDGQLQVALEGYRCTVDDCVVEGPDALTFQSGQRVARPTFVPVINAPPTCPVVVETVYMPIDRQVDTCPEEPPLPLGFEGGGECANDTDCAGTQNCDNGYCMEPAVCANDEDCRDGRYCAGDSCASPCTPLRAGEVIEQAGEYAARLRVADCAGNRAEATMNVSVLERPIAEPGGNLDNGDYEIDQGDALLLNGSESFAPPEVGGIVEYAWDLNNDGFFDADQEVFDAEEPTVPFNTASSGEYRVRMRVTAGNGAQSYRWFNVNVADVDPRCDAGGPYQALEGEAVTLDASGSAPGHPTDPIRSYSWEFGDLLRPQSGERLVNPVHIYGEGQNVPYTITLTVADPDSESVCTAEVIVADVSPQLDGIEILNPQSAIEGERVAFRVDVEPGSQADPISNISWTFGVPGAQAEGPLLFNTQWNYVDQNPDGSPYNVCVTVQDEDSFVQDCIDVDIQDLEPTPHFEGPARGLQGEELTFDASATVGGGAADPLSQLVWDWGDGSNLEVVDLGNGLPNQFIRSHSFTRDGVFTVQLRAVDEDSAAVFERVVTIEDAAPTARARAVFPGPNRTVEEGVDLLLDASESTAGSETDPIDHYLWDFGDGETRRMDGNQQGVTHQWGDEGAYEVQLTAVDIDGSEHTTTIVIEVVNRAPTIQLIVAEEQVAIGEDVEFTAISGAAPDGMGPRVVALIDDVDGDLPPALITWSMGDGSTIEQGTHRYAFTSLGRKIVTLTVDDGDGGEAEAQVELVVTPAAPNIEDIGEQRTREGTRLEFEFMVMAPTLGPGQFDEINVRSLQRPPGSSVEVVDDGFHRRVQFSWTPTYFDAGHHRLWIEATSSAAERRRIVDIVVDDGGVPRIVAAGGTPNRGVVSFFDYERGDNGILLRSSPEVDIGLGAGDLAVNEDGSHVWVTVPGSNRVAIVSSAGAGSLLRRVEVGMMPSAIALGGGWAWVTNQGEDTISIINEETMKLSATFELPQGAEPTDIAWLPGNEGDEDRVLVTGASGHLYVLDANQIRTGGINPILAQPQLGGILSQLIIDHEGEQIYVADAKTRTIYVVDLTEIEAEQPEVSGHSLDFAARDMVFAYGRLWVATGNGLLEIDGDVITSHSSIYARSVAIVGADAVNEEAIAIATGSRVENYLTEAMDQIISTAGSRVRRLATLVAPR